MVQVSAPESPLLVWLFDTPWSLPLYLLNFMLAVDLRSEFHIRLAVCCDGYQIAPV